MDDVQEVRYCNNTPSSQTFRLIVCDKVGILSDYFSNVKKQNMNHTVVYQDCWPKYTYSEITI